MEIVVGQMDLVLVDQTNLVVLVGMGMVVVAEDLGIVVADMDNLLVGVVASWDVVVLDKMGKLVVVEG